MARPGKERQRGPSLALQPVPVDPRPLHRSAPGHAFRPRAPRRPADGPVGSTRHRRRRIARPGSGQRGRGDRSLHHPRSDPAPPDRLRGRGLRVEAALAPIVRLGRAGPGGRGRFGTVRRRGGVAGRGVSLRPVPLGTIRPPRAASVVSLRRDGEPAPLLPFPFAPLRRRRRGQRHRARGGPRLDGEPRHQCLGQRLLAQRGLRGLR